ncbi:hypothetical protein AJ80_03591 [Polytolypa hystricis UAMH7299]|uniref:Zn(2)-C6 fungal-type domain-containing protein n=1 Tax=Polytolypa hystricis (strain UAMH7299) TaxID=1447883 RepID=A0A2B7YGP1_POLH7|nr:hypothetical protein AJ80_03591 [Polytolypa hystricis UAMH7299]
MPSEGVPKCQRCRRDHKKCSPENREWPGPKCDRCESYGYDCSENMMARKSSQKDIDSTRAVNRLMEGLSQSKYFCHQTHSRTLAIRPSQLPMVGSMPPPAQYQFPGTRLFEYLKDVDWLNLMCPPATSGSDPFAAFFHSGACLVPNLPGLPLGRRQMYVEAFLQSHRNMQNPSSPSSSFESAVATIVAQLQQRYPRMAMIYSFEELSRVCTEYIRYGSYWNLFKMELQTDEVLLIDPNYSFDGVNPSTTFESARRVWMCPELGLGLKQFCQKLSGLSKMISDLARSESNSEERLYLAAKIHDRLQEVLGPRPSPPLQTFTYPSAIYPVPVASSPVEMGDGDVYSLSDSAGAEESDDGFSLGESSFRSGLIGGCFNQNVWST